MKPALQFKNSQSSICFYFGMRDNLPKTRYVVDSQDFVKNFISNTSRLMDATIVGEDLRFLQFQAIDDAAVETPKPKIVLAAFTKSHARTVLYVSCKELSSNQIFFTLTLIVSCKFRRKKRVIVDMVIPLGSNLGDMKK